MYIDKDLVAASATPLVLGILAEGESYGYAILKRVEDLSGSRIAVLCGPGNNGGDGYVVARLLARAGWRVRVLGTDNIPGPDAAETKRRWAEIGDINPLTEDALRSGPGSDVYVDAIFGTGLTRPPEGEIAGLVAYLGGSGGDWGLRLDGADR